VLVSGRGKTGEVAGGSLSFWRASRVMRNMNDLGWLKRSRKVQKMRRHAERGECGD
jgi:hypothetical protein